MIRVGILGCGRIARVHIPYIRAYQNAQIVGVVDVNRGQAEALAKQYGIPAVYGDLTALLHEGRPDVVHIVTPPQTHADLAIAAMEAGVHVLVEKPMAVNAGEAEKMVHTARRLGVHLVVDHNRLFDPVVIQARDMVVNGVLGDVVGVEAFQGFSHTEGRTVYYGPSGTERHWAFGLPGGILQNFAPHSVSLFLGFLPDARCVSVARRQTGSLPDVPAEEVRMLFEGSTGLGSLTFSLTPKPYLNFLNLYGSEGSVSLNLNNMTLTHYRESRRLPKVVAKTWFNVDLSLQLLRSTFNTGMQVLTRKMSNYPGIRGLVHRFYACIEGAGSPPVTPEEGLDVVRVLDLLCQPATEVKA